MHPVCVGKKSTVVPRGDLSPDSPPDRSLPGAGSGPAPVPVVPHPPDQPPPQPEQPQEPEPSGHGLLVAAAIAGLAWTAWRVLR